MIKGISPVKSKLVVIILIIFALPHFSHADFISGGHAGAIIVTDNGSVFVPGSPGLVAISGAPIISSPFLVNKGSELAVIPIPVPANAPGAPNFTGVNNLLGAPGPVNGPLLGTPGPGNAPLPGSSVIKNVIVVNPARHSGKHH